MAKTWILDTETKGTGANMVALEKVLRQEPRTDDRVLRAPRRKAREPEAPRRRGPYRFRILDVMTRQLLADDVDARAAVAALQDVRSVVDVAIDVWDPEAEAWQRLTLAEQKKVWALRA
jgi:hypothetical protein